MGETITQRLQTTIQKRINDAETSLSEVKEWITRLKNSGFDASSLELKVYETENTIEKMRSLLL